MTARISSSPWMIRLAAAALLIAGIAAYANSLRGPLIYDDLGSITSNETIRHLSSLGQVFRPPAGGATVEGRPILNLSLALNYAAGGPAVEGYHLVNLLIHLAAGLVLFGLVRRTWVCPHSEPDDAWIAALAVALIWTVHPLQTESVTYVVQRAESLMGLCYLLTLYGGARYLRGESMRWACLSVGSCLVGTGVKEVIVTAPVMVLFYDRAFVAGSFRQAWSQHRSYYLALASTWIPLGLLVAGSGGNRSNSVGLGVGLPWHDYLITQGPAIVRYLRLSVWPSGLVFDYGPLQVTGWQAVPAILFVTALGAGATWGLLKNIPLGFAGFGFFGILAVTSLTPGTSEMIVERRMYLPLAAVIAVGVAGLMRSLRSRILIGAVTLILTAVLVVRTARRNEDYRSSVSIWADAVAHAPANPRGWYNLGVAWWGEGQNLQAISCYREALRYEPSNPLVQATLVRALVSVGITLAQEGRWTQALEQFQSAEQLKPDWADAHVRMAITLWHLGRYDEAVAERARARQLDPTLPE